MAMYQGMVVLPFVFLTSLVLLFAILILADHERLEQANRLAGLREVYYQGLRQQETQVRRLRHDLRNHLTAVRGFLEQGDEQGAIGYLDQIAGSRPCGEPDGSVKTRRPMRPHRQGGGHGAGGSRRRLRRLPAPGPACGGYGSVRPAGQRSGQRHRGQPGAPGNGESPSAARRTRDSSCCGWRTPWAARCSRILQLPRRTSRPRLRHPGMREIAERYGGTLDAGVRDNGFELVCAAPGGQAETL